MSNGKVALIILDGYGIGEPNDGNAIYMAQTPVMDGLLQRWPHTKLSASGLDVGLPDGQMGNSEVGHTNIGSGRVVFQDLPRITKAIEDGTFFENPVYAAALDNAANGKALHILGLLSDGGVHSHIRHIFAMVKMAHDRGIGRVYLHCFLDGRDVAPTSGAGYVRQLRDYCAELGTGKIATLQGRFYGMDRDKRWDRIEASYNAMVCGEGIQDSDPVHAMEASYAAGVTDEFVKPVVCDPNGRIQSGDSVIFMNFRPDRAREMTYALTQPDFDGFRRKIVAEHLHYVCTTRYDEKLTGLPVAFPPEELHDTLGEIVSAHGLRQLRILSVPDYRQKLIRRLLGKDYLPPVNRQSDGRSKSSGENFLVGIDCHIKRFESISEIREGTTAHIILLSTQTAAIQEVLKGRSAVLHPITIELAEQILGLPSLLPEPDQSPFQTGKGRVLYVPSFG